MAPLLVPAARALALVAAGFPAALVGCGEPSAAAHGALPERLSETGLFADVRSGELAPGVRPFSPQYPLWTDGAAKRRWVLLPEGARIDARDPDAWSFPIGTKFWKEFAFGERVETRHIARGADGEWRYATYLWEADGSDAVRAPEDGVRGACATGLGTVHDIPSVQDCRACHEGSPSRILGFGALQLAAERDPLAPHAETPEPGSLQLEELLAEERLLGAPAEIRAASLQAGARTPRERAVLGTLHANCGGCHNASGPLAPLGLDLRHRSGVAPPALATTVGRMSSFRLDGEAEAARVEPGAPERSVLYQRMDSRFGAFQMPPLGTHARDEDALALLAAWIRELAEPALLSQSTPRSR
jgi:hypothetical protein